MKIDDAIITYLKCRFDDSNLSNENDLDKYAIIYLVNRIRYGIEKHPCCKHCGKPIKNSYLIEANKGHIEYCCCMCAQHAQEVRDKIKQTCLTVYGNEIPAKTEQCKNKSKETCQIKYHCDYTGQAKIKIDKTKATFLAHYSTTSPFKFPTTIQTIQEKYHCSYLSHIPGVIEKQKDAYYSKSDEEKNKIKETRKNTIRNKYGVAYFSQSEMFNDLVQTTSQERYQIDYYNQLPEARKHMSEVMSSYETQAKSLQTKLANKSIGNQISAQEQQVANLLKEKFGKDKVKQQYLSDDYPWACDIYVEPLNLYIECHFFWTHGKHHYDKNNDEDNRIVEKWKSKHTKFYNAAIQTWTVRDIKKYELAKERQLNYLVFYTMDEFTEWLNAL